MNKNICFAVAVVFIIIFVFALFLYSELAPSTSGGFFTKREWANLQSVSGKEKPSLELSSTKVINFNSSEILLDKNGKCKILLNCYFPPYFKMFGELHDCHLSKEEIEILKEKTNITSTVLEILKKNKNQDNKKSLHKNRSLLS